MTYVIAEPCIDVKDQSCVDACPVDCIYEGLRMLYIHPEECIDCRACEATCPVDAIYSETQVPDVWHRFVAENRAVFEDVGSPGGAGVFGLLPQDTSFVAEYVKQPVS